MKQGAVDFVQSRISAGSLAAERRPMEENWFSNMAYLYGKPFFVPENGTIRPPKDPRFTRNKYQANLILPKVFRSLAKLQGLNATLMPLPMTDDRRDVQAAKLARLAFEHAQIVTKFKKKKRRAMMWAAVCGSGFLRPGWNPDIGSPSRIYLNENEDTPNIEALFNEELRLYLEQKGRFREVRPGDLELEVIEPFQMWWDRNARGGGFADCTWAGTQVYKPIELIKSQWGVDVPPDNSSFAGVEQYRDILAFLTAESGTSLTGVRPRDNVACEVEVFEVPLATNGWKGRHVVMVGDQVVKDGPNEYGRIPYVKYDWFPVEGRFLGLSLVEQLRGPQKARNEARTHMMRFMRNAGYGMTLIPKGNGVKPIQVANMPGLLMEYDPANGTPAFSPPPQLGQHVPLNAAAAEAEMNEISAQADPTSNGLPGQLRSGVAVAALQSDNNAILTPTSEAMLDSDAELGTTMLELMGRFYDTPRMIQVQGPNGELDVRRFVGTELRGHYRIQVIAQPDIMDSTEARHARLLEAAQLQILNPADPDDKAVLMRGLAFNTKNEWADYRLQQEMAEQREIDRIIDDPQYEAAVLPWNDPTIRARVLERFLNTLEFQNLDQPTQMRLVQRWQQFSEAVALRQQQQMDMMQASRGTPGQTGQASQPRR